MKAFRVCMIGVALQLSLWGQPAVTALTNNYSYIRQGLPNYGIAQGSIFDIWGTGLAASATPLQGVPLQTTLSNVSVNVTVNGTTVHPLLYFVAPTQIGAILPSATPVGTGQITVTNGSQTSAPFQIQVLKTAFGLLTMNNGGTGPAAAYDKNYNFLGFTNAVNPGETISLWGSGLGPVTGDESVTQTQQNLDNIPITVEVGGVSAQVPYHGRSIYPGLDQVNVTIPQGVQGCYVSVAVRAGDIVSNIATIPVAASGRTCSDQASAYDSNAFQTIGSKGALSIGSLSVGKTVTTTQPITVNGVQVVPGGTTTTDFAGGTFIRYTASAFQGAVPSTVSIGSCIVTTFAGNSAPAGGSVPSATYTVLNAGSALNLNGPNGKITLTPQSGFYLSPAQSSIVPGSGGTFTFDNGSGGPDVGAFTASLNMAAPLTWTNMSSLSQISRKDGVTVTWSGGDSAAYASITGMSITADAQGKNAVGGVFSCTAPVSAHQFTVPSSVLLSIPATGSINSGGFSLPLGGYLGVSSYTPPQKFTATGLDLAYVTGYVSNENSVTYQ